MGLVVLCTKAQNGFCPMCTKECCMVPTCSKPFWGQFWGRNGKADSYTHRSNKCAALVPLRNADTNITGFTHRKSPTNQYISFILQQEVVRKHCSAQSPHNAPVTARNTPVWARSHRIDAIAVQPNTTLKLNCTPFVRQYDILSNRWGDLLCQEENRTNDIRRSSRKWL